MRKIGLSEIEDIALGASLLGAGGGGDPMWESWWLSGSAGVRPRHPAGAGRGAGRRAGDAHRHDGCAHHTG